MFLDPSFTCEIAVSLQTGASRDKIDERNPMHLVYFGSPLMKRNHFRSCICSTLTHGGCDPLPYPSKDDRMRIPDVSRLSARVGTDNC